MAQETVRFMSASANCLVAFEEIRKTGMRGEAVPWKMEKFVNNSLTIKSDADYGTKRGKGSGIIKRLRFHSGNRVKGGNVFWEMDQNAVDVMEMVGGKLIAREPTGGITKELNKDLEKMYGYINGYDVNKHDEITEELINMFDLFNVMGIPKPEVNYDHMRVKGRLIEFFGILKEREIWEPLDE